VKTVKSGLVWIAGGGVLGVLILGMALIGIPWLSPAPAPTQPPPQVTVVLAPTETAVPPTPIPSPTLPPPTATPVPPPAAQGGFNVGDLVEVNGTSGDGLRMRSDPGLNGSISGLAGENEVFRVQNGPEQADDYTWWFVVSPYDDTRKGWVVANYLRPLQNP
jgi:hypothetical protein